MAISKHLSQLRILLIGPFPEPAGGVSIHLERLMEGLEKLGYEVDRIDESPIRKPDIFNMRNLNIIGYIRRLWKADVAHIQSGVTIIRCFHIICSRMLGVRTVVTIHTMRIGRFKTLINRLFLRAAHSVVVVNKSTDEHLNLKSSHILPAFLPPNTNKLDILPEKVQSFIDQARHDGRIILCANAYRLILDNGQDLYGLDLCIQLIQTLIRKYCLPVSCIYIVASDASDNPLYSRAVKQICKARLTDYFCLYNGTVDFCSLMKQSSIILRPTTTDADALTVREAIWMGKPVITSDVVTRPSGAVLFKSRNINSLIEKTLEVIRKKQESHPASKSINFIEPYINLYSGSVDM